MAERNSIEIEIEIEIGRGENPRCGFVENRLPLVLTDEAEATIDEDAEMCFR